MLHRDSCPAGELPFEELVATAVAEGRISREAAAGILSVPEDRMEDLLGAAFQVREHFQGRVVRICALRNARSGLCGEDCAYCSQSRVSRADVPTYPLIETDEIVSSAHRASAFGARRFCTVTSGKHPTRKDLTRIREAASRIREEIPGLELCVSIGMLHPDELSLLKESGIRRVNHNLNTSERFYPKICGTHMYADRVRTVEDTRRAGLAVCSGVIIGMGETDEDLMDLAFVLRDLEVDAIPVNFLHPIEGTPLAGARYLTPVRCLKVLCLFRFVHPAAEIRVAGGWEYNLGAFQPQSLLIADSLFVGGYLTTPGKDIAAAQRMIEEMGLVVDEVDYGCRSDPEFGGKTRSAARR